MPEITDEQLIEAGLMRWEPGTLSHHTVERIMLDAMADLWQDCRDRHPTCNRNLFREKVMSALLAATGERMVVR